MRILKGKGGFETIITPRTKKNLAEKKCPRGKKNVLAEKNSPV